MFTRKLVLLIATVVSLTGCSAPRSQDADPAAEQKNSNIHVSRTKDYTTMAQLKQDSTAIIVGKAGVSSIEEVDGIPFTLTQIVVDKVWWGSVPSQTIAIRQLGGPATASEDTSTLLAEGSKYIAFVQPFHMMPGDATGQYIVTGDRGLYELDSKARRYAFKGGEESSLPSSISMESATTGGFIK